MTLHEAIAKVLAGGKRLQSGQIADAINRQRLYVRGDGRPVPSSQISARVRNYSHLFNRDGGLISLRSTSTALSATKAACVTAKQSVASTATSNLQELEFRELGSVGDLIDHGIPHHKWLDSCGIYQLKLPAGYTLGFIQPADASAAGNVIKPWSIERLRKKWVPDTDVVYIGLAGRHKPRSLRERLTDLVKHARGRTNDRGPHSGGEIVWQLAGYRDLRVWAASTSNPPAPRKIEASMIRNFEKKHGALPFANRQR